MVLSSLKMLICAHHRAFFCIKVLFMLGHPLKFYAHGECPARLTPIPARGGQWVREHTAGPPRDLRLSCCCAGSRATPDSVDPLTHAKPMCIFLWKLKGKCCFQLLDRCLRSKGGPCEMTTSGQVDTEMDTAFPLVRAGWTCLWSQR